MGWNHQLALYMRLLQNGVCLEEEHRHDLGMTSAIL